MEGNTEIWDVVRAYSSGGRDSTVLTVPHKLCKELGVAPGHEFVVRTDREGRIIFEPLSNDRQDSSPTPKKKGGDKEWEK